MNRTVDATAPTQRRVSSVHDNVHVELCDIGSNEFEFQSKSYRLLEILPLPPNTDISGTLRDGEAWRSQTRQRVKSPLHSTVRRRMDQRPDPPIGMVDRR